MRNVRCSLPFVPCWDYSPVKISPGPEHIWPTSIADEAHNLVGNRWAFSPVRAGSVDQVSVTSPANLSGPVQVGPVATNLDHGAEGCTRRISHQLERLFRYADFEVIE